MAVLLSELIKQIPLEDAEPVAGGKGPERLVRWLHMVESPAISDFMEGGEIAFTTGIGLSDDIRLIDLVRSVYDNNGCAMFINVGPYIHEIGEDVLSFADEHDFPLFRVPWRVHMAQIMRIFSQTILRSEENQNQLDVLIRYAVRTPGMENIYLPAMVRRGFLPDSSYQAGIVNITAEDDEKSIGESPVLPEGRIHELYDFVSSHIRHFQNQMTASLQGNEIWLIKANGSNSRESEKSFLDTAEYMKQLLRKKEQLFIAVGEMQSSLSLLHRSFEQAESVQFLAGAGRRLSSLLFQSDTSAPNERSPVLFFHSLGFARMLLLPGNDEEKKRYALETAGPLFQYDATHNTELVRTLTVYFSCGMSVRQTSDEMMIHRNTVNQRIQKTQTILHTDLSKEFERTTLILGLFLYQVLICAPAHKNMDSSPLTDS